MHKINSKPILDYIRISKISEEEFCKECKISMNMFKKIINSDFTFNIKWLVRIGDYLGLNIRHFFSGGCIDFTDMFKKIN